MSPRQESDILMKKVSFAASDSFDRDNKELQALDKEKLFEVAYIHGFNCGHNIYDAAEEKIDILKQEGDVPVKDFPNASVNGTREAHECLRGHEGILHNLDSKSIYITGYQQGFSQAWSIVPDEAMNDQMLDIINYYI